MLISLDIIAQHGTEKVVPGGGAVVPTVPVRQIVGLVKTAQLWGILKEMGCFWEWQYPVSLADQWH